MTLMNLSDSNTMNYQSRPPQKCTERHAETEGDGGDEERGDEVLIMRRRQRILGPNGAHPLALMQPWALVGPSPGLSPGRRALP